MYKKGYGWVEFIDDEGREHTRKLYSHEREEVLVNYIRRRSGRKFTVPSLAKMLATSDRTIQKHLAELEQRSWIKRVPCYNEKNRQDGNVIVFTGPKPRLTGDELTVEKVYDKRNVADLTSDTD